MRQWKRWTGSVIFSAYCALALAQQDPQFTAVSPLMMQETNPDTTNSPLASPSPILVNSAPPAPLVKDPYEKMNRKIFNFNDTLDTNVLVPVSKVYNKIIPKPLNKGIYNFFSNLNNFPTISNDLLQGNFYQATSDSWRFLVNSTAGACGLFDVAQNMGLEQNSEDFGLTLARWGYDNSDYLVLPFFGPSTLRDAMGLPVDYFFFSPYGYVPNSRTRYTLYALNIVSKRAELLQYQDIYNQIALDRYAFIRNAYLQQRKNAIDRNQNLSDPYFNLAPTRPSTPTTHT